TWKWTDVHSKTRPVYRYYYERPRPALVSANNQQTLSKGAVHSAEIEYAMGNLHYNKVYAWTENDFNLSKTMQQYFDNFIKTANPNGAGLPQWTPVKPGQPAEVMHIDVNTRLETEKHRDRYLKLDEINK